MRQAFFLLLTLLLLKAFMPELGQHLEQALLSLLDMAQQVFTHAQPLG